VKLFCPYCTKEIDQDTLQCPFCGTSYASETIQLLTEIVKVAAEEGPNERRRFIRIPKKFKLVYSTPKAFVENFLSNIGQGGVFIPTNAPLETGTQCDVKIVLPDGKEEIEIFCEVVWVQKEEIATPEGISLAGMGVKFLNLSPEGKERIDAISKEREKEIDKILGRKNFKQ
jgi:type IV pilus assembly protein PilZ